MYIAGLIETFSSDCFMGQSNAWPALKVNKTVGQIYDSLKKFTFLIDNEGICGWLDALRREGWG